MPPAVIAEVPVAEVPAVADVSVAVTRRSRRVTQTGVQSQVDDVQVGNVHVGAEPFQLVEPPVGEAADTNTEPLNDASAPAESFDAENGNAGPTAAETDAFDIAARLFAFTGETPVQSTDSTEVPEEPTTSSAPSRRNRGASFKRATAASFSIGVMGIVGLLTVGMTTPADAVAFVGNTSDITTSIAAAQAGDIVGDAEEEIQAYVAPAEMQSASIDRPENYETVTMAEIASESGIQNFSNFFVNDPNSPIQWPFAVGVPISYGFGMRSGAMHEGVDFTPGAGSPIQAIADGVVRQSTDAGGAYGVTIIIDHEIDGQLVSSHYGHMQYGSRQVQVGDHVTVGTVIGRTGNTGRSYGAHTHFEILMNGTTPIDPIPWLRQHAGG